MPLYGTVPRGEGDKMDKYKEVKKTLLGLFYIMLLAVSIGVLIIECAKMNEKNIHAKELHFSCNPMEVKIITGCPNDDFFYNITGVYCRGKLVCQNNLGDKK